MASHQEIERKFMVRTMPDLSGIEAVPYERYILFSGKGFGLRIQNKAGKFEIERKSDESETFRNSQIIEITQDEFDALKKNAIGETVRDGYTLSTNPYISIKIYRGKFEGLRRAEVQFANEEEANNFKPLAWMGQEITDSPLGKDAKLAMLTGEEFQSLLGKTLGN
jgi:CYTH domain-containing protein